MSRHLRAFNGQPWWAETPHRWLALREAERADADAVDLLGSGDLVVSLSGGADSSATYLHLKEQGFLDAWEAAGGRVFRVFMDTGWELSETYRYLDELERVVGRIHRIATWVPGPGEAPPVGFDHLEPVWKTPGKVMDGDRWAMAKLIETRIGRYCPMVRLILQWGKVPTSVRKWCTADLKQRPVQGFLAGLDNPVNVLGVRAEESAKRSRQPAFEWSDDFDAWIWRPIKWWSKADRVAIHARFGLAPNPLYLQGQGAGRVGCRVCVNSGKEDLLWIEEFHPETIEILDEVEMMLKDLPTAREAAGAGAPMWFSLSRNNEDWAVPVREAVRWAHTGRGGRQAMLFRPRQDPGCSAWGLCEVPER